MFVGRSYNRQGQYIFTGATSVTPRHPTIHEMECLFGLPRDSTKHSAGAHIARQLATVAERSIVSVKGRDVSVRDLTVVPDKTRGQIMGNGVCVAMYAYVLQRMTELYPSEDVGDAGTATQR